MTQYCTTVNILAPPHIVSTNIEISPTNCTEPCDIQITVTWKNTGDIQGIFAPGITVDGEAFTLPQETLGEISVSHSFTVSNLARGPHTIYASPPGAEPKTITVDAPVMEAGLNEREKFVIVGLYIGIALKAIEKWKKMSTEKVTM